MGQDHCLALQGGEVVEVLGAGAGWLYGRLVGPENKEGYFPEDRAAWDFVVGEEDFVVGVEACAAGDSLLRSAAAEAAASSQGVPPEPILGGGDDSAVHNPVHSLAGDVEAPSAFPAVAVQTASE